MDHNRWGITFLGDFLVVITLPINQSKSIPHPYRHDSKLCGRDSLSPGYSKYGQGVIGMLISEITLVTNQADKEAMQNILQQIPGVRDSRLRNQQTDVIFDPQKTQYDCILEKIMQAGYQVIWFYVTEDDEN